MMTWMPDVKYEFVVINDGSPDNTLTILKETATMNPEINMRVISPNRNTGKGYAVKLGVAYSLGKYLLMVDADGATDVKEIKKFYEMAVKTQATKKDKFMLIGSRSSLLETLMSRPWHRRLPSVVNNVIVKLFLGIKDIKDTQCGFKLFTKQGGRDLFEKMHLSRWAFDVEMLLLAQR
jgi:dolichyl-phosphate beta-glucosyltransferase